MFVISSVCSIFFSVVFNLHTLSLALFNSNLSSLACSCSTFFLKFSGSSSILLFCSFSNIFCGDVIPLFFAFSSLVILYFSIISCSFLFHPHSSPTHNHLLGVVQRCHVWAFNDEWHQSSHFHACLAICRLHILQQKCSLFSLLSDSFLNENICQWLHAACPTNNPAEPWRQIPMSKNKDIRSPHLRFPPFDEMTQKASPELSSAWGLCPVSFHSTPRHNTPDHLWHNICMLRSHNTVIKTPLPRLDPNLIRLSWQARRRTWCFRITGFVATRVIWQFTESDGTEWQGADYVVSAYTPQAGARG